MRLKSLYIAQYKNLRDFSLIFEDSNFIDVFVGTNGSGKSNLFEALIEIFRHLDQLERADNEIAFDYKINYEIDGIETEIEWNGGKLRINKDQNRTSLGQTPFPDNVLIYYSGHNTTVSNLIDSYTESFRRRIKGASLEDSRRFIGIGPEYKALLLAVLLVQPEGTTARTFISKKLGIEKLGITKPGTVEVTEPVLRIELRRPEYAEGKDEFNFENNDDDRYWKAQGITKDFLDILRSCTWGNSEGLTVTEGYLSGSDRYVLYISINKLQQAFADKLQDLFLYFDNLKTLGMLADVSVPLRLISGGEGNLNHFSDGQFQSVYIYSIVELFKGRNCLTLLDEPDAFLHPEWQFLFLKQVFEITSNAVRNNHILMSSHSASTITSADQNQINLISFDGTKVSSRRANKDEIIRSLSAGLISFSESEARLNINHILRGTSGAVLFAEGITDEMILELAWSKLYPDAECPCGIQNAFDRIFLRNLFSREDLKNNFPERKMFALFDFDEAFDDWNGLKKARDEVTDPHLGLTKQLVYPHHYATLLPVPNVDALKCQVLDKTGKPWGRGQDSHLSIELLFYSEEQMGKWFRLRPTPGGGEIIEFFGDKVEFAKTFVPTLSAEYFAPFRPLFDFIIAKCRTE
ncbi:ATP-binding protein [Pseudomonas sp. BCA14]|uniref:AAA family ATPase n=1 Tax=unclassified Pseudomonas TaxID=196821 RepID=UPI00106DDA75|nr:MULTISPECIES: AAA family ATPase [unclassified Pseudomonas]TFF04863.1 ATP-binding protein [Pseudomonas sp. JMN1]TFF06341.1 ATP-binding protein [Pseudomonas sp. BCA17]TFF22330.1 ATP-binding protein [Pseudomonas sp. BCA14]TFF26727.1 ATP-binding protein [Pseudomonas sp. BCA13]